MPSDIGFKLIYFIVLIISLFGFANGLVGIILSAYLGDMSLPGLIIQIILLLTSGAIIIGYLLLKRSLFVDKSNN
jgi:hypothetical protein